MYKFNKIFLKSDKNLFMHFKQHIDVHHYAQYCLRMKIVENNMVFNATAIIMTKDVHSVLKFSWYRVEIKLIFNLNWFI